MLNTLRNRVAEAMLKANKDTQTTLERQTFLEMRKYGITLSVPNVDFRTGELNTEAPRKLVRYRDFERYMRMCRNLENGVAYHAP